MRLNWDVSHVFLIFGLGWLDFRKNTTEVKCLSHPVMWRDASVIEWGTWCQHDPSLVVFSLMTWLRNCLPGLSILKFLFFFFHSILTKNIPYLRMGRRIKIHLLKRAVSTYYMEFFKKILSLLICMFVFNHLCRCFLVYLYFWLNPILHHLFCSNFSKPTPQELFQLSPCVPFDTSFSFGFWTLPYSMTQWDIPGPSCTFLPLRYNQWFPQRGIDPFVGE